MLFRSRISDQLTGPVPGDLASAVHVHHRRTVERAFARLGAAARAYVRERFAAGRLVQEISALYETAAGPEPLLHVVMAPPQPEIGASPCAR